MSNIPSNNSNFSVNTDNLRKCFEILGIKTQQNQQMLREVQKYIEECKSDPMFPAILLQFFEREDENLQNRWLALIEFKNLVKENWNLHRNAGFSNEVKNDIRAVILTYLDKYQNIKIFRDQIHDILRYISLIDFPSNYPTLVEYFLNNIQALKETLGNEELLMSDITMNFVRALKAVLSGKSRRRTGDHKTVFYNVYFKMLEGFHDFWDFLHTNTQKIVGAVNDDNIEGVKKFVKLTRMADKIYISFLVHGSDELVDNPDVLKIISLLVQRCVELRENTKSLKEAANNSNVKELYSQFNKNLYKFMYALSTLQTSSPYLFKDCLVTYMNLIEFILNNGESFTNTYVLSATAICLISALRRYSTYNPYGDGNPNKSVLEEAKKHCVNTFATLFSSEKIENYFNIFLLKLLPIRLFLTTDQNSQNPDDFVEIENDSYATEFEKLETPLYNLTLKCALELMQRFAQHSIPLIHNLTTKIIQNEIQDLPAPIIDGIFAMVGQLPQAYTQSNVDPSQYLDFESVLKYLQDRAESDLNLSKRIPVLIQKWISLFDAKVKTQIVQMVVNITEMLPNYIVKYECCMCLKVILKKEDNLELEYASLSEHLIPIVVDLLGRFKNPQAVWGLIEVIKILFVKARYSSQNDNILAQLQSENILELTKVDDPLKLPALADMFKTVIASFPFNTPCSSVFVICIEFIDYHFRDQKFYGALLGLWLFLVREYTDVQGVGDAMKALFSKYLQPLLTMNSPDELSKFINIIEEYVLADFILPEDYLDIFKIMEDKYELSLKIDSDNISDLKSALLSLMSTLLLIVLKQENADNLKLFEKMLSFLLKDLLNPEFECNCKSEKAFHTSLLTLLNRFIILNFNAFVQTINNYQIDLDNFFACWTRSMQILSSPQTKQINSLAVLTFIPNIKNKELFGKYLQPLVIGSYPNFNVPEEKGQAQHHMNVQARCEDVRDSERKKEIRKTGLYSVNLPDLFKSTFLEAINEYGLTLDEIKQCVTDGDVINVLLQLGNN